MQIFNACSKTDGYKA